MTLALTRGNYLLMVTLAAVLGWVCVFVSFFGILPLAYQGDRGYLGLAAVTMSIGWLVLLSTWGMGRQFRIPRCPNFFWVFFLLGVALFDSALMVGPEILKHMALGLPFVIAGQLLIIKGLYWFISFIQRKYRH